jgi:hypothetical protein
MFITDVQALLAVMLDIDINVHKDSNQFKNFIQLAERT